MDPGETGRHTLSRLLSQMEEGPLIHLPMCVYVADAKGTLAYANRETRALLRLGEDVSASIADFTGAETWEKLLAEIHRPGKTLIHLNVGGDDAWVEHYLAPIPYEDAEKNGLYVGCMTDVTEDHVAATRTAALQETVREMTFDIGQVLHANTSTLVMVNQTLMAAARAMEPELA